MERIPGLYATISSYIHWSELVIYHVLPLLAECGVAEEPASEKVMAFPSISFVLSRCEKMKIYFKHTGSGGK